MRQLFIFFLPVIAFLFLTGCRPCDPCDDPMLVRPDSTGCQVQFKWSISTAVHHSNGTVTSAIIQVADPGQPVHRTLSDSVTTTVYVMATDTSCGVRCLSVKGNFGFTCTSSGIGLAVDGMIPEDTYCTGLTKCAYKTLEKRTENLEQFLACGSGRVFSSGGFGFTAKATNSLGQEASSSLAVSFGH